MVTFAVSFQFSRTTFHRRSVGGRSLLVQEGKSAVQMKSGARNPNNRLSGPISGRNVALNGRDLPNAPRRRCAGVWGGGEAEGKFKWKSLSCVMSLR